MDFLYKYGLTDEDVKKVIERNGDAIVKNVTLNKTNVIEVVDYLLEVGVNKNVIRDLFIEQIGMFFRTKDEIADVFDEYEIESIVKSLNYDVNTVDLIEFS